VTLPASPGQPCGGRDEDFPGVCHRPALPAGRPAILVRPDWARLDGGDLPGVVGEVRFAGPHTDYHVATPAGPLLIREAGPPRAGPGPVRWSLLRARLMPRERPSGRKAAEPRDLWPLLC